MKSPSAETDWVGLAARHDYEAVARALISEMPASDLRALRENPESAVEKLGGLQISYQGALARDCGGGGYYDRRRGIIFLHDAGARRNAFTLLHEFGHRCQQAHPDWAFVLLDDIPGPLRLQAEEQVSHQFAGIILLGEAEKASPDPSETSPALVAASLFDHSGASRSAAVMNVKQRIEAGAKWILAVADLRGEVVFATSTYDQPPPAKHSIQSEFASLASEATTGPVARDLAEGIAYRGGLQLEGMRAQAVLDHTGQYAFVALTPTHRFSTGNRYAKTYQCESAGCATEEFTASPDSEWCTNTCREPKCPECNGCNCPHEPRGYVCDTCFIFVTDHEAIQGTHDCD